MTDSFLFAGLKYDYFDHPSNMTSVNERRVEVPIVLRHMKDRRGKTLEVGNVLSQYIGRHKWTTVDLREKEEGVVNADIVGWMGSGPYSLIVSISTFEHIGIDDGGHDPFKAIEGLRHCIKYLLAPGGKIVVTVPMGYNTALDAWLMYRWHGCSRYLLRISRDNRWVEVDRDVVEASRYGKPYPFANALIVAEEIGR